LHHFATLGQVFGGIVRCAYFIFFMVRELEFYPVRVEFIFVEDRGCGAALDAARKGKATLLIAKLDRLARNVAFIANLMDAGVEFLACDQPFASRLTLHILAAVAEDEARRISERTKAALQAAKARGRKLGSPVAAKTVAKARAARSAYAAKANATTLAVIREVQGSGVETLAGIARALRARGVKTPAGRYEWQPVQVSRLLAAA
jgi:DNA invertase Pin-like site-specific DNA recombinase